MTIISACARLMATLNRLQLLTKPRLCSKSNSSISTEERTWGSKTYNQLQLTGKVRRRMCEKERERERESWQLKGWWPVSPGPGTPPPIPLSHPPLQFSPAAYVFSQPRCKTHNDKEVKKTQSTTSNFPASGWLVRPTLHNWHLYNNTPPVLFANYYYSLSHGSYPVIAVHTLHNLYIPHGVS